MPTFFETEEDEDPIRSANPLFEIAARNTDYFSAYKLKPSPWNPDKPLSEFHTGTPRFKSPEELEGRLKAFIENALKRGQPLTPSGMANAIGTNRKQFMAYQDWYKDAKTPEDELMGLHVNRIISAALAICEQYSEEKLFDGKMKPQGILFQMVNNFGWKNKIEVEANDHAEELGEIREAYLALLEKQKLLPAHKPVVKVRAEIDKTGKE